MTKLPVSLAARCFTTVGDERELELELEELELEELELEELELELELEELELEELELELEGNRCGKLLRHRSVTEMPPCGKDNWSPNVRRYHASMSVLHPKHVTGVSPWSRWCSS